MRPQYGAIGGHYGNWKQTPIPVYLEVPTVRRLLDGLVEGQVILDLACGTGFYSRLLKQLGAGRVIGVDISEAMIAEARLRGGSERHGALRFCDPHRGVG